MSDSSTIGESLTALEDAPNQLALLGALLSDQELLMVPTGDEWSVNDVLAHLRACADVWGGYILRILAEDTPTIRAVSPRTWATRKSFPKLAFRASLDAYRMQRAELVAVLRALQPQAWARTANVLKGAKTHRFSVETYVGMLVSHERAHVEQLHDIAGALRKRR